MASPPLPGDAGFDYKAETVGDAVRLLDDIFWEPSVFSTVARKIVTCDVHYACLMEHPAGCEALAEAITDVAVELGDATEITSGIIAECMRKGHYAIALKLLHLSSDAELDLAANSIAFDPGVPPARHGVLLDIPLLPNTTRTLLHLAVIYKEVDLVYRMLRVCTLEVTSRGMLCFAMLHAPDIFNGLFLSLVSHRSFLTVSEPKRWWDSSTSLSPLHYALLLPNRAQHAAHLLHELGRNFPATIHTKTGILTASRRLWGGGAREVDIFDPIPASPEGTACGVVEEVHPVALSVGFFSPRLPAVPDGERIVNLLTVLSCCGSSSEGGGAAHPGAAVPHQPLQLDLPSAVYALECILRRQLWVRCAAAPAATAAHMKRAMATLFSVLPPKAAVQLHHAFPIPGHPGGKSSIGRETSSFVSLLLDEFPQHLDVNAVNEVGLGPLHIAVVFSMTLVVEALLSHPKIDAAAQTRSAAYSGGVLHLASIYADCDTISLLLRSTRVVQMVPEPDARTLHTPLHNLCARGEVRSAALLLRRASSLLQLHGVRGAGGQAQTQTQDPSGASRVRALSLAPLLAAVPPSRATPFHLLMPAVLRWLRGAVSPDAAAAPPPPPATTRHHGVDFPLREQTFRPSPGKTVARAMQAVESTLASLLEMALLLAPPSAEEGHSHPPEGTARKEREGDGVSHTTPRLRGSAPEDALEAVLSSQDSCGDTVLHHACRLGCAGFIESILSLGAAPNPPTSSAASASTASSSQPSFAPASLFSSTGARVIFRIVRGVRNAKGETLYHACSRSPNPAAAGIVAMLFSVEDSLRVRAASEYAPSGGTAGHSAAQRGAGAGGGSAPFALRMEDMQGLTPLCAALRCRTIPGATLGEFLEKMSDLIGQGVFHNAVSLALPSALAALTPEQARSLLRANSEGLNALHFCAKNGDVPSLKSAIGKLGWGSLPEIARIRDPSGETIVHHLVSARQPPPSPSRGGSSSSTTTTTALSSTSPPSPSAFAAQILQDIPPGSALELLSMRGGGKRGLMHLAALHGAHGFASQAFCIGGGGGGGGSADNTPPPPWCFADASGVTPLGMSLGRGCPRDPQPSVGPFSSSSSSNPTPQRAVSLSRQVDISILMFRGEILTTGLSAAAQVKDLISRGLLLQAALHGTPDAFLEAIRIYTGGGGGGGLGDHALRVTDTGGNSAAHLACLTGLPGCGGEDSSHRQACEKLGHILEHLPGVAFLSSENRRGLTPLRICVARGFPRATQTLLKAGVPVSVERDIVLGIRLHHADPYLASAETLGACAWSGGGAPSSDELHPRNPAPLCLAGMDRVLELLIAGHSAHPTARDMADPLPLWVMEEMLSHRVGLSTVHFLASGGHKRFGGPDSSDGSRRSTSRAFELFIIHYVCISNGAGFSANATAEESQPSFPWWFASEAAGGGGGGVAATSNGVGSSRRCLEQFSDMLLFFVSGCPGGSLDESLLASAVDFWKTRAAKEALISRRCAEEAAAAAGGGGGGGGVCPPSSSSSSSSQRRAARRPAHPLLPLWDAVVTPGDFARAMLRAIASRPPAGALCEGRPIFLLNSQLLAGVISRGIQQGGGNACDPTAHVITEAAWGWNSPGSGVGWRQGQPHHSVSAAAAYDIPGITQAPPGFFLSHASPVHKVVALSLSSAEVAHGVISGGLLASPEQACRALPAVFYFRSSEVFLPALRAQLCARVGWKGVAESRTASAVSGMAPLLRRVALAEGGSEAHFSCVFDPQIFGASPEGSEKALAMFFAGKGRGDTDLLAQLLGHRPRVTAELLAVLKSRGRLDFRTQNGGDGILHLIAMSDEPHLLDLIAPSDISDAFFPNHAGLTPFDYCKSGAMMLALYAFTGPPPIFSLESCEYVICVSPTILPHIFDDPATYLVSKSMKLCGCTCGGNPSNQPQAQRRARGGPGSSSAGSLEDLQNLLLRNRVLLYRSPEGVPEVWTLHIPQRRAVELLLEHGVETGGHGDANDSDSSSSSSSEAGDGDAVGGAPAPIPPSGDMEMGAERHGQFFDFSAEKGQWCAQQDNKDLPSHAIEMAGPSSQVRVVPRPSKRASKQRLAQLMRRGGVGAGGVPDTLIEEVHPTPLQRVRMLRNLLNPFKSKARLVDLQDAGDITSVFPVYRHNPLSAQRIRRSFGGAYPFSHMASWLGWGSSLEQQRQKLHSLKAYCGESVAFYFAWLCCYEVMLLLLTPLAGAAVVVQLTSGFADERLGAYSAACCLWGVLFVKHWSRRQSDIGAAWGVYGRPRADCPRPTFHPLVDDSASAPEPGQGEPKYLCEPNPFNPKLLDPYFPTSRRRAKYCVSLFFVLLFIAVCCFEFYVFVSIREGILDVEERTEGGGIAAEAESRAQTHTVSLSQTPLGAWVAPGGEADAFLLFAVSSVHSLAVMAIVGLYKFVSDLLTEFENHKYPRDFARSLVLKYMTVQLLTNFIPPLYILYNDTDMLGAEEGFRNASLHIAAKLVTEIVLGLVREYLLPFLMRMAVRRKSRHVQSSVPRVWAAVVEYSRGRVGEGYGTDDFKSLYGEFSEMVLQFSFVMCFSSVCPAAVPISLLNNFIEFKGDLYKVLCLDRRSLPHRAHGIGAWETLLRVVVCLSVSTNTFCLLNNPKFRDVFPKNTEAEIFLTMHVAFYAIFWLHHVAVGDATRKTRAEIRKQEAILNSAVAS